MDDKEYFIKKWLNNNLTDSEEKLFNASNDAELYKEIVAEAARFRGNSNAKVHSYEELEKKLELSEKSKLNWLKIASGIAAIFVIGFTVFKFFSSDPISSYKTEITQNKTITLPDNSIVNLNELSSLEFKSSDWDKKRSLNLRGEAFFDVEKGKLFDVLTEFGKVSVLGTEFNIISRDSIFKVSCYEGLVQVSYNDKEVRLPAGTEFILKSGKGLKTSVAISEPQWLKNMSVFKNALYNTVIEEFEKHYKVNIEYPSDVNSKFTGAFELDNIDNALKSITVPFNYSCTITNENVVIIRNE